MDYSNIKKIFYILCIISLILSIKTKVFATSEYSIEDFPTIPMIYTEQDIIICKNVANTKYVLCVLDKSKYTNDKVLKVNNNNVFLSFPSDSGKVYTTNINNGLSWDYFTDIASSNHTDRYGLIVGEVLLSSIDIYYDNGQDIYFQSNYSEYNEPYFINSSEIENGYPDGVYIEIADYEKEENLYFHLLEVNRESVSSPGNSVFYYSDNIFELNKNNSYYQKFTGDEEEKFSYYYIPRYELSFNMDTSYVYVLTSSPEVINNSYNHIEKDINNGVYDVIESDTSGVMTATDLESDRLNRIEQETISQSNNSNSINNALTNTNTDSSSEQEISANLNFNNNSGLDNINQGFFSRLTSLLNTIVDYDIEEIDSINLPIPFTNRNITLYSNMVSSHIPEALKTIFQAFWLFLFNFYLFKFINKIYIAFSTGKILSGFSSSDEAITNSML